MNEKQTDLAGALVEVRHAYRLLHAYHRRLCDLLQVTDEFLSERKLRFEHWAPLNVARLPRSKKPFFVPENWAWDLTPAYQVECTWEGSSNGARHKVHLHAIADTGYDASGDGEPDPSRFEASEAAVSELRIGLYRTRAKKPDWSAAWEQLSHLTSRKNGTDHTVTAGGNDYTHRYFDVNLTHLVDERAVQEKLLAPLGRWIAHT